MAPRGGASPTARSMAGSAVSGKVLAGSAPFSGRRARGATQRELLGSQVMATRVRLGELLVEAQVITRKQLDEVLVLQKTDARRLGTLLVEAGLVTETQVTQILSQQLSVPWVSLYHIDFSRQLLNLVPHETAEKYCLLRIFVRCVRGLGDSLFVAMDE